MTRETAKTFSHFTHKEDAKVVYEVIDKIYDDFENRACKNCKYFHPQKINLGESFTSSFCLELEIPFIEETFGCNKFILRSE